MAQLDFASTSTLSPGWATRGQVRSASVQNTDLRDSRTCYPASIHHLGVSGVAERQVGTVGQAPAFLDTERQSKWVSNDCLFAIGWKEPPLLDGGRSDSGEQVGKVQLPLSYLGKRQEPACQDENIGLEHQIEDIWQINNRQRASAS